EEALGSGRQRCADEPRPGGAGRQPRCGLQHAGHAVRVRLPRQREPVPRPPGRGRGRQRAARGRFGHRRAVGR
ncbi:hypothetical protein COLO4_02044, partial [Corchorus olitorius]